MLPIVSIVIVNWNTGKLLSECISSIFKETLKTPFEIIVVDNASNDDSMSLLDAQQKNLKLIYSDQNLGFGAGNNLGVSHARGEVIVLLNPDTLVLHRAIDRLVDAINKGENQIGMVGPELLNKDNSHQRDQGCKFPSISTALLQYFFLSHLTGSSGIFLNRRPPHRMEVDWLSGACMCVKKKIYDELGGFDEKFFLYAEDLDLCRRLREKGFRIEIIPDIEIIHISKQSTNQQDPSVYKMQVTNLVQYYRQHHTHFNFKCFQLLLFSGFLIRYLCFAFIHICSNTPTAQQKAKGHRTLMGAIYAK